MKTNRDDQRVRLIPAVYLILARRNTVLLLLQEGTGYEDGRYSLPAGHPEENEDLLAAMVRETYEETGISLSAGSLVLSHTMHRMFPDAPDRIDLFFTAGTWCGEPQNTEPAKCASLAWHPAGSLPANTIPYIGAALGHWQSGVTYSSWSQSSR